MSQAQTGTSSVWGFWRVDGGYTPNLLLASRPKATGTLIQARPSPQPRYVHTYSCTHSISRSLFNFVIACKSEADFCNSPPKRSSDGIINVKRAKQAKQDHVAQETEIARNDPTHATKDSASSTSSGPSVVPREWATINAANFIRQSDGPQSISSKAYGKLPLRYSMNGADNGTQLHPTSFDASVGRINEDDDLYDATPRPQRRPTQQGFFKQYAQPADDNACEPTSHQLRNSTVVPVQEQQLRQQLVHHSQQRDSPTIRQDSTPVADNETAHAPYHRFRYFITVSWAPGQNVVMLADTMDVQSVYTRVQRTLRRKLEGRDVVSLSFSIQDEEHIDVEVDDRDAWETVVDMIKDAGLFAVKGTVLRSD